MTTGEETAAEAGPKGGVPTSFTQAEAEVKDAGEEGANAADTAADTTADSAADTAADTAVDTAAAAAEEDA